MAIIDADAHVIETQVTWDFMTKDERKYRPIPISGTHGEEDVIRGKELTDFWAVDGRMRPRERNIGLDTSREAREMTDVSGRIAHMDELGIDVQVLYPSIFLRPITRKPEIEMALIRSYNRWLTDIWKRGGGKKLRWVAMAPMHSLNDRGLIRAELAEAKSNGACGIFTCGFAAERELWNPYFFPLYEIAQDLNLPICLHAGVDSFAYHGLFEESDALAKFKFPVISAFHALLLQEIPARFPNLRWGFIEAGSGWLIYVLSELRNRMKRRGKRMSDNILADNNMFVACQINEDLPAILKVAGEDNLVIGTDYGHSDNSTQIEALRFLKNDRAMPKGSVDKILEANPSRLYAI
jgi:predicted TIM-barrel fold metal-dependent hydrolase